MEDKGAEIEKCIDIRFTYLEKLLDERFQAQEKALNLKTTQAELSSKNSMTILGIILVVAQIAISLIIHFATK